MSDCSCEKCVSRCRFAPGWMSPEEARKAIAAGYAEKLMVDYLIRDDNNIYVLGPAVKTCEANRAPNTEELFGGMSYSAMFSPPPPKGVCVFLKDKLCSIHNSGFKPIQCRDSYGCRKDEGLDNYEAAAIWDNPKAQTLVREWMRLVRLDESALEECN